MHAPQTTEVDPFKPQPPLPMPHYDPLIVTPVASRKRPGQIIAFIGKQMCFFERGTEIPPLDEPAEVMITRALYSTKKDGGGRDWTRVFALLLRAVTPDWTLIAHDGFECTGSMCTTTATMIKEDGTRGPWLTPGRTEIFEASNVNAGRTWNVHYTARRPGKAWVSTKQLKAGKFPLRIEGLARVEDGIYARAVTGARKEVGESNG